MPTVDVVKRATARGRVPIMSNIPTPLAKRLEAICRETCLPFTDLAVRALEQYLRADIAREQTAKAAALRARQQAEFEAFVEYQRTLRQAGGANQNQPVATAV